MIMFEWLVAFLDWLAFSDPQGTPTSVSTPKLFGHEHEEREPFVVNQRSSSSRELFGAEPEEDSDSSSTSHEIPDKSESVFNFGWEKLHALSKASFMREVGKAGHQSKQKRHYNNSDRANRAAYKRKRAQTFQDNGLSESRLLKVLNQETCLCAWSFISISCLEDLCYSIIIVIAHWNRIIWNSVTDPQRLRCPILMLLAVQTQGCCTIPQAILGFVQIRSG